MTRSASGAALTALLTTACAAVPQQAEWVEARPLQIGAERQVSAADGYYSGAVAAIGRRDYAAALELLQMARARAPSDVRIFNAFGVVYDKLGRFDLSARYYSQAAALEPSSPIIAANVAYSAVLEHQVAQPVEGVRLARADGELRRFDQPDLTPEPAPVVHRIVQAASAPVVATAGPPVRIEATRTRLASASPRPMAQPAFSEASPPLTRARAPALDPIVAAPQPAIAASGAPVRIQAASTRPASASPRPMRQPTFAASTEPAVPAAGPPVRLPLATAAVSPQAVPPAAPRHVLYPIVSAAASPMVASAPVRVDAAGRPSPASLRAMGQPTFVAAAERPPAAGPPVRLALVSQPPSPRQAIAQPARRTPVVRLAATSAASSRVVKLAAATPAPRRLPLLTGNTLLVINASGRQAGGDPVVTRLARLGWSVPKAARPGPAQSQTSIVYPARNAAVAQALARTLPYKVRLVNCASRCDRMRLVVGADALAWRKGPRPGSLVRAKRA
ncbi:LytR C-terminal domain-containing protein [Phenylobacterium sp.]|uniref:LytR C-terminal domain-containing protein n=1 Tax=Phenylobacterium sp. TaxID=1871053 RepID=UPI002ED859D3